jgi:hypothetical protein
MVELFSWLLDNRGMARDAAARKGMLIGGVVVVSRVKDPIVAHKGLEIKLVLGMTLNPAAPQISTFRNATATYTTHLMA